MNKTKYSIFMAAVVAALSITAAPCDVMASQPAMTVKASEVKSIKAGKSEDIKAWLKVCASVKKAASEQCGYRIGHYSKVKSGKKTYNFREDSSGYVSVCLNASGLAKGYYCSASFAHGLKGFKKIGWDGNKKDLRAGDILVMKGHTAIYTEKQGDRLMGYSWGSKRAASVPGTTQISVHDPVCILRLSAKTAER